LEHGECVIREAEKSRDELTKLAQMGKVLHRWKHLGALERLKESEVKGVVSDGKETVREWLSRTMEDGGESHAQEESAMECT
jgi:DNA phosphorothioation-dependent restriction protein DptG